MQLGETIATYDVALALRGESGKFDVTSPTGEIYHVTCTPNHSISNLEWSGNRSDPHPFIIRKVAEPVSPEQARATTAAATAATAENGATSRSAKTPFLLESQADEAKSASHQNQVAMAPKMSEEDSLDHAGRDLELLYLESDAKTQLPSACVCLKDGSSERGVAQERLTATCSTFNELDAEIRRLQGQLDEIRSRARKKFYKTQADAMSA